MSSRSPGLKVPLCPRSPPAQGEALQTEVLRQMRERQEAAKRKREALEQSKYR